MEEWLSKIKVSFYLTGEDFDTNILTNKLMINPTKVRNKEEFPGVSKELGLAGTSWKLETKDEVSRAVSIQMDKLIEQLKGKEKIINKLCNEYDLQASFAIVINIENDLIPELILTKEIIAFASLINAEIGFDIYSN